MVYSRRVMKTSTEVRMPFIGDTVAASVRRETSLFTGIPGFCMQLSLLG